MIRRLSLAFCLLATPAGRVAAEETPLRIVTFGTSLTARGGWQAPLEAELARCLARPVTVETVALVGSTSEWALTQLDAVAALAPDIVLVEFSVNDASLQRWISLSESRENMATLFDGLRAALPQARIFDMAMSPVLGLRGWVRPFLDDYIEAHRELAADRGLGFVDFRPGWASLPDDMLDDVIPDGSHPDPKVASAIIVPTLVRRLAGPCAAAGASDGKPDGTDPAPGGMSGQPPIQGDETP